MSIFSFKNKTESPWIHLTNAEQLDALQEASFARPQLIFKHSTTCSISKMAKGRMEEGVESLASLANVFYLDLLAHRSISNEIAHKWNVQHESPQVILIKNGVAIYHTSHNGVMVDAIKSHLI